MHLSFFILRPVFPGVVPVSYTHLPEDTVTQIFAEKFAEEVSDLSDGKMKIQVYANSTLGGDRDLLELSLIHIYVIFLTQFTTAFLKFVTEPKENRNHFLRKGEQHEQEISAKCIDRCV